jgi:hypothetical protein
VIRHHVNGHADAQARLEAAIARYAETGSPTDQAEAVRLYEAVSKFKAGCGVCVAGRKLFIDGLTALASGDTTSAAAKLRGAVKSVRLKLDILRGK